MWGDRLVGACAVLAALGCGDDSSTSDADATSAESSTSASSTASTSTSTSTTSGSSTSTSETGTSSGEDSSSGGVVIPEWDRFLGLREQYLLDLAVPIKDCAPQLNTNHPAFHGCIDWHSAVHATYSLLAIYRLTGDMEALDIANSVLEPAALDGELQEVMAGQVPQEIPYGYAWFLTLARERERATGQMDLVPLADEIAMQLSGWIAGRSANQITAGVLGDDYANLSWAVLNLWEWGTYTNDMALVDAMETFADDILLDPYYDTQCPLSQEEVDKDDFFPPCLHRAHALTTMREPAEIQDWLDGFIEPDLVLTPIGEPLSAHIAGLNFSRAWGLWSIHTATDDVHYRDLTVEHIVTHVEQPQYWEVEYFKYSHWVAQFGVYAIAQTYERFP